MEKLAQPGSNSMFEKPANIENIDEELYSNNAPITKTTKGNETKKEEKKTDDKLSRK